MTKEMTEFEKCKSSPYYYATKHVVVTGPDGIARPFKTRLNEEEFNKQFHELERNTRTGHSKPENAGDKEVPAERT